MNNSKDGLSRQDRLKRLSKGMNFSVLDNGEVSLLQQSLTITGFLRYYNFYGNPEGYFNDIFKGFNNLDDPDSPNSINKFYPATRPGIADGNVEPSEALLLIFIEHLHDLTQKFNARWKKYPEWYLQNVLKVKSLPIKPNKIWISLEKKPFEAVIVKESSRFVTVSKSGKSYQYKPVEDIELLDTTVAKGYILNFEKDGKRVPESIINFVTAVKVKELQVQNIKPDTSKQLKTIGVKLTSPALLLREGERNVTITFYDERHYVAKDGVADDKPVNITNLHWLNFLDLHIEESKKHVNLVNLSKEELEYVLNAKANYFNNIFFLSISTTDGWMNIDKYSVTYDHEKNALILTFKLEESFPATCGCTMESHEFISKYPTLNVRLNFDAWMYPYSWIKQFLLYEVKIETDVKNVSNLHIYNELGKVDISKPFPPFGINNEKGSWFAVGNYEMAIKNTQSIDIDIHWRQLPEDNLGLNGYYNEYENNIGNASFTLQPRYLSDFLWKETSQDIKLYLFSTKGEKESKPLDNAPLINETRLEKIDVGKMSEVKLEEEEYEYTQKSRSGFIDFTLVTPQIGFGETVYRKLFTEQIMKNARKDQKYPTINPPINPLIERVTLNYKAIDVINLHEKNSNTNIGVDSILPIGSQAYFPGSLRKAIPFVVPLEESNLLLALKDVVPGKPFSLFFDFIPSSEEITENQIPAIKWYIGNMRHWEAMPPSFIVKDETRQLSVDGRILFLIPKNINPALYDSDKLLWIRGGVTINEKTVIIPKIKTVHHNAVQLILDMEFKEHDIFSFKGIDGTLELEKNIPGVTGFKPITSFYEGRGSEDNNEMLIRVSEHITHQGKAVTPRDYERIVLQAFPDIAKVKCFKHVANVKSNHNVYLSVIPYSNTNRPLASNYMMLKIERFLSKLTTAYLNKIKITNPVYEEILVRVSLKFNGDYLSEARRKQISDNINNIIAPWQKSDKLPEFGYSISLKKIHEAICREFKSEIEVIDFAVMRIEKNIENATYKIYEYNNKEDTIYPSVPNVIFVPENEHIIHIEGIDTGFTKTFGIEEMKLGDTFIIK